MKYYLIFNLIFFMFITGCNHNNGEFVDEISSLIEINDSNKELWLSHGMDDYRISFDCTSTLACGLMTSYVEVSDGNVSGELSLGGIEFIPLQESELEEYHLYTIDGLFMLIQTSIYEGKDVIVEYDESYGFPKSFIICEEGQRHDKLLKGQRPD